MSGQYSDERFFFAHYGCCIPTESYAWILVVLFATTILVLLFCMLATATIRWMYKRRMRKRLQDLKKKYLHDQLKAQEFDAKLNHIALAQKNKLANGNTDSKDAKSEKFTIFVDPAQDYALHKQNKKPRAHEGSIMKTAIPAGAIYDQDETPIAQSTMPTQNNAPIFRPPATAIMLNTHQQAPQSMQKSAVSDPPFVFNPPEKKASPVNTLDTELSPRSQARLDKALAPPSAVTSTVESTSVPSMTVTSENKSPSEDDQVPPPASSAFPSVAPSVAPIVAPTTAPSSAPRSPPRSAPNSAPSSDTSSSSKPPSTAATSSDPAPIPLDKKPSPTPKTSPTDGKTQSLSPSEEEDKKHRVEYGMDDIVSPHASEKEKESSRKEAGGGRSDWKYYCLDSIKSSGKGRRIASSTVTRSTASNRPSSRSWLYDSTGSSRFSSAPEAPISTSSSILKTDSSQYKTAAIEQFPHGAFTFQE